MIDVINAAEDHNSYTVVTMTHDGQANTTSEWECDGDVTGQAMRTVAAMVAQSGSADCRVTLLFHTA